jgi:ABC-type cobalamin/Fe3+-siderophores transport system ATPase subunit
VGKRTLLALSQRLYDVRSGTICIDGVDIRNFDLNWLQRHIGYVEQDPPLLGRTVKENVLYRTNYPTTTHVTHKEMEHACKIANAHDFVMEWPDRYDTLVMGETACPIIRIARTKATSCHCTCYFDELSNSLVGGSSNNTVIRRIIIGGYYRIETTVVGPRGY